MIKNLENVKLGLSLINKEESKMASNFVREITKDPSKKKQGKPPILREKVFAWLVEAGLLENGYVRGYQIFEIVKDLKLEIKKGDSYEDYEKSKNQVCKDVRRQIDVFVNLGLLNKYKNGYTKYNLDIFPNENDKEYKRRCRNTEYGITKKVEWYICLTNKFYNDCDSLGYSYSKRFNISELNKFDKDGIEFSKLKKASFSSYSFNYKERTTITATGKVTLKTNSNEVKNIIEKRNKDIKKIKNTNTINNIDIEEEMLDLDTILDKLNLYSKDQLIDLLLRKNIIYNDYSWNADYPYKDNPKYEDSINIHFYDDCKSIKDINITEELLYELL